MSNSASRFASHKEQDVMYSFRTLMYNAMKYVKRNRFNFDIEVKGMKEDGRTNKVTNVDTDLQKIMLESIQFAYPEFGIIAEEGGGNGFTEPDFVNGKRHWIVIDPIDGTSAFVKTQPTGIAVMLALVEESLNGSIEILLSYIGDPISGELYGFDLTEDKVFRIVDNKVHDLYKDNQKPFSKSYIQLRHNPMKYSEFTRNIINVFRDLRIPSGSIGISMAQLWMGHVKAVILRTRDAVGPWDWIPIAGISMKLGFEHYYIEQDDSGKVAFHKLDFGLVSMKTEKREHELLIIPSQYVNEFMIAAQQFM